MQGVPWSHSVGLTFEQSGSICSFIYKEHSEWSLANSCQVTLSFSAACGFTRLVSDHLSQFTKDPYLVLISEPLHTNPGPKFESEKTAFNCVTILSVRWHSSFRSERYRCTQSHVRPCDTQRSHDTRTPPLCLLKPPAP